MQKINLEKKIFTTIKGEIMKIRKRIAIVADILVDEDFDTNYLCICQDISDQMNMGDIDIYVGRSDNFEVLDYISQDAVELENDTELCTECGKNVAQGSSRFVNRVVHFDRDGYICAECDEKLRR